MDLEFIKGHGIKLPGNRGFINDKYAEKIRPSPLTERDAARIHARDQRVKGIRGRPTWRALNRRANLKPLEIVRILRGGGRLVVKKGGYDNITEISVGDENVITVRGTIKDYALTTDEEYLCYTRDSGKRGDELQELVCMRIRDGEIIWKEGGVGAAVEGGDGCVFQTRANDVSMQKTAWRRGMRRNSREECVQREMSPYQSLAIWMTSDSRYLILAREGWLDSEFLQMSATMDGEVKSALGGVRGNGLDIQGDIVILKRGDELQAMKNMKEGIDGGGRPVLECRRGVNIMDFRCYEDQVFVVESDRGRLGLKIVRFSPARRRWSVQEIGGRAIETEYGCDIQGGAEIVPPLTAGEEGEILIYVKGILVPAMTISVMIPEGGVFRGGEVSVVSRALCGVFDRGDYETADFVVGGGGGGGGVPYVVFRRRGAECRGAQLLVYGAQGSPSQFDTFGVDLLALMDAGVWVVVGMIRGGGEFGEDWHLSATGVRKMNSVEDCVSIVRDLVKVRGVPGVVVKGRSAGGWVAGRLLSLGRRIPGLRGVNIQVGFVDNLATMLDLKAPLTLGELKEFGNPLFNDVERRYLEENGVVSSVMRCDRECVAATRNTEVLLEQGMNDTRVRYTEGLRLYLTLREKGIGRRVTGWFFPDKGHLEPEVEEYESRGEVEIGGLLEKMSARVEWILRVLGVADASPALG